MLIQRVKETKSTTLLKEAAFAIASLRSNSVLRRHFLLVVWNGCKVAQFLCCHFSVPWPVPAMKHSTVGDSLPLAASFWGSQKPASRESKPGQSFKPLPFSFNGISKGSSAMSPTRWQEGCDAWVEPYLRVGKKWSEAQWEASALLWRSFTLVSRTFIHTKAKHGFVFGSIGFKLNCLSHSSGFSGTTFC